VHIDDDGLSSGIRAAAERAGFSSPRPVIEVRGTCADCRQRAISEQSLSNR
jgi:Fur family zinc uptake transcriptional regulator